MYLNSTSVQNRKPKQCVNSLNHHQNRMLIIPVAPFFSGVWCHNMCCKVSALKELYYLLNVWRFKKVTFFPELYVNFMSINVGFPILKSVEIQKNTSLLDWLRNVLSQKQSFGKVSTDFSGIYWRRMRLSIIWDMVCFPLGSGFFTVVWFLRLTRWLFFYFGGVLLDCLIFDWWEWFSITLMIYPLLLTRVSCLLICLFCSPFQSRELSVWMRLQERRGNFILTQSNTLCGVVIVYVFFLF